MKSLSLILALAFGLPALLTQDACDGKTLFQSDEHGVAYCTTKGTLFKRNVEVVGKSLDVEARIVWSDTADQAQIEVSVPIQSLNSGSRKRDKHVAKILGAPEYASIHFRTGWLEAGVLCERIAQRNWVLPGNLVLKGTHFPVDFELEFSAAASNLIAAGSLKTTFSRLGVEVPSVGPGGMIARPHDNLDLFVHLQLERVDSAESLLQCFSGVN